MTIKIENIRPDYDEGDILVFEIDGKEYSEYLSSFHLGRETYHQRDGLTDEYRLSEDFEEEEMEEIHSQLNVWIAGNKGSVFEFGSKNPDIERIEHGLNMSEGIDVFLTKEALDRLNIFGDSYSISGDADCATVTWRDREFGRQEIQFNPGEPDRREAILHSTLSNPASVISDIEDRLEWLREDAEAGFEGEDDEDQLENDDEYSAESIRSLTL
ncbi:hypothetical protein [Brucella intermedia]|uniref:hypothetical protein n=1 Tax=Brucella intermedia TaxID=94625 RepID=UPI000EFD406E|nr:hypothetical protein [Brucella intermedia]KAB2720386.1 hypothetical protein F9K75_04760 [Brucella intermedia]WGJ06621.1 hypothetical protein QBQ48_12285 [Brucella intermedia]